MTQRPILADPADRPLQGWDDPARGSIRWRTLLTQGLTDTAGFTCGIAELAPGEWFVEHRHDEPEIYLGLAGAFDVMVAGERLRVAPERALYIPGGALHGIPAVAEAVRFFYCFAADSFDWIDYTFPHEAP